jgi:hypothetical protein
MLGIRSIALAMLVLVALSLTSVAKATVFHPASDPIEDNKKTFDWSTTPGYLPSNSWYSDNANKDIGGQSPTNVRQVLETATWIGVPLTFISGGTCTVPANCTTGEGNSGTWTYSGTAANVFGIHFGNNFIALLFADALTAFSITGLPNGVSNIYAYNVTATPIPAALLLFGSGLGIIGFFDWLRRRRMAVA